MLKRRKGGRHRIKDRVHTHTPVANECMQSGKGVKSKKITFSPAKKSIPRSNLITC